MGTLLYSARWSYGGATVSGACEVFGLNAKTIHRWRKKRLDIMAALGDFEEVLHRHG